MIRLPAPSYSLPSASFTPVRTLFVTLTTVRRQEHPKPCHPKAGSRCTISEDQTPPDPQRESRLSGLSLSPSLVGSASAADPLCCAVLVVIFTRWLHPGIETERIRIGAKAAVYTLATLEYHTAKVLGAGRILPSARFLTCLTHLMIKKIPPRQAYLATASKTSYLRRGVASHAPSNDDGWWWPPAVHSWEPDCLQ